MQKVACSPVVLLNRGMYSATIGGDDSIMVTREGGESKVFKNMGLRASTRIVGLVALKFDCLAIVMPTYFYVVNVSTGVAQRYSCTSTISHIVMFDTGVVATASLVIPKQKTPYWHFVPKWGNPTKVSPAQTNASIRELVGNSTSTIFAAAVQEHQVNISNKLLINGMPKSNRPGGLLCWPDKSIATDETSEVFDPSAVDNNHYTEMTKSQLDDFIKIVGTEMIMMSDTIYLSFDKFTVMPDDSRHYIIQPVMTHYNKSLTYISPTALAIRVRRRIANKALQGLLSNAIDYRKVSVSIDNNVFGMLTDIIIGDIMARLRSHHDGINAKCEYTQDAAVCYRTDKEGDSYPLSIEINVMLDHNQFPSITYITEDL